MKKNLFLLASIGFYLAALVFILSASIGTNAIFAAVGALCICTGTLYWILARKQKKSFKK